MPTLATGTSVSNTLRFARTQSVRQAAGFTLIEIMIVVFIIGLITAAAVITFGGDRRDTELDKEAQRLDALFDYVREQAELQTRDYGFRVNAMGYSFVTFDVLQNQWR
jgi:general secretion pathway protein H